MLTQAELFVIRQALSSQIIEAGELRTAMAEARNQGLALKKVLFDRGVLAPAQWDRCMSEARCQNHYPESPAQRNLDNQAIYQGLKKNNLVDDETLRECLALCERLANPEHSPRLHEVLISKGLLKLGEAELYLGIEKKREMGCEQCRYSVSIQQFFPWQKYPCLFCGSLLQKGFYGSHSRVEEKGEPAHSIAPTRFQPPSRRRSPSPAKKFGRYEILEKLGEGGMGAVYKAYDTLLQRTVAIKMVLQTEEEDASLVERFYREINVAAGLSHPHIVPIYEVDEVEGTAFFSMGFIEGVNLREYVENKRKTKLSQKQALAIMEKLCRAVFYAHEQGVVHRDIKPENIMIDDQGDPFLMDFGLARNVDGQETRLTKTGSIMGSPEFMAPEQALGEREVSYPADIYALGGTLYFMLTGRPPFQSSDVMSLLNRVVSEPPLSPRHHNRLIARDLETIVLKCLHKQEKDRYSHAGLLLRDIQAFGEGSPIMARPLGKIAKLTYWIEDHKALAAVSLISFLLLSGALYLWVSTAQAKLETEDSLRVLQNKKAKLEGKIKSFEEKYNRQKKTLEEELEKLREKKEVFDRKKREVQAELVELRRKKKEISASRQLENRLVHANYLINSGNYGKALQSLRGSLRYNKKQNLIYTKIGVIHYFRKNYQKALENFQKAREFGLYKELVQWLVRVHLRLGQIDQALKVIEGALKEDRYRKSSVGPWLFLTRGSILIRKRQLRKGEASLREGIQLVKELKMEPSILLLLYAELGNLYRITNEVEKALEAYQKGLAVSTSRHGKTKRQIRQIIKKLKKR